jgi:MinD superfamily P-loop ATPase
VLCDADVDAADLHLLMAPKIQQRSDFMGGGLARIDSQKCTACGLCRDLCQFGAINEEFVVDAIDCEGCGVCVDLCPEQAIDFPIQTCGEWFISETRFGPMVHARLGIAEENSGKLVALIRGEAKKLAKSRNMKLILTDGPPGVGCPVIAAIGGATTLLIVTEPTVAGVHDMERALKLANHFHVPATVCINKFDLNTEKTAAIEALADRKQIDVLGRIPFDPAFTESMVQGKTLFEHEKNLVTAKAVKRVWERLTALDVMQE